MKRTVLKLLIVSSVVLLIDGCSTRGKGAYRAHSATYQQDSNTHYNRTMDKKTYSHPTMRPYVVRGIKYYPTVVSVGDTFKGRASWYGPDFHGKLTSNGEHYNMYAMTAAHKTLPMNTIVRVTNLANGRSTVVRINDRGPFVDTRIIDLSKSAAKKLDMLGVGTAKVKLEVLGFASKGEKQIPTNTELKKSVQKKNLGNFYLQIASFSRIEGAIITQEKYDGIDGYKTIIKDVQDANGRIFKVMLQGFKSRKEAVDYKTRSNFTHAFIVKED
jgi:rare lipoprotein A